MIILEDTADADYQIQSFEPGKVVVNQIAYTHSFIITSHTFIADWEPQSLEELTIEHLAKIITLKPKIVLLGTGEQFKIPKPEIISFFHQRSIGMEYMNTGAACRTYTALISEGRNVAAGILIHG